MIIFVYILCPYIDFMLPRFPKRWNIIFFPGRHDVLFAQSRDSLDQSEDTLYGIIILKYNNSFYSI